MLYEAPHRVVATVADLTRVFGADRGVVLVRELTKLHEEVWRGSLGEAMTHLAEVPPRGEYVLVLAGAPEASPPSRDDIESALLAQLGAGVDRKTAIADVARAMSVPKRAVYDVSLGLRS